MVQFGQNPGQGTLLRASQFLLGACFCEISILTYVLTPSSEELPVRLAHRAKELDELPHNLSNMTSIQKVKNWYAQSFEVRSHAPFLKCDAPFPSRANSVSLRN
jgi:pyruvate dehydrogenase kinase 2/3/4